MKSSSYMPEDKMVRQALEALMSALGPVETMRFLTLPRQRRTDSVRRHRKWQDGLDPSAFFDEVFGMPDHDSTGNA